jgi:hypothetical protein
METPAALAISRIVARAFPLSSVVLTPQLNQISVTGYNISTESTSFGFVGRPINGIE